MEPLQVSAVVRSPLQNFVWPNHLLCSNMDYDHALDSGDHISSMPVPTPPIHSCDGFIYHYPEAVSCHLRETNAYLQGLVYTSKSESSTCNALMAHLVITRMPPNVHPHHLDSIYKWYPIPGMIELLSRIPFAQVPVYELDHLITIPCLQTINSLKQFHV
jgi:hypothetical protein